jgi:outer membrane lipoprotein-sorting protein
VSGAPSGFDVTVSNGSVTWLYDEDERSVTRVEIAGSGTGSVNQGERIERLFNRLTISPSAVDERETAPPDPGVSPLPVVPGSGGHAGAPSTVGEASFGVRYTGIDTVDGRDVYVLSLRSPDENASEPFTNYSQTMYLDTEWFVPLRTETAWTRAGNRVETTTVYRNVTFNPGFEASRFEFDPPEDATVDVIDGPTTDRYDSLASLRENASMTPPDPDLPESFTFRHGTVTSGNVSSVSLRYTNTTAQLVVSKNTITVDPTDNGTDGERVTVDGRDATYQRIGNSAFVTWDCGEFRYSVTGTGVSRDLLLRVAASVGCA